MLAAAKYIGAGVACSGLKFAEADVSEFMVNMSQNLLKNLFINNLVDLVDLFNINTFFLTIDMLGLTLIIGTIILATRGITEGLKAAANLATIIALVAATGNSRAEREDCKQKEENRKKEAEKQQQAALEAGVDADSEAGAEEEKREEENAKNKKVEGKAIKNNYNYTNSSSIILG
jgi:hypothetical protein